MLNKPIEEIVVENGKVVGVKSEGEVSTQFLNDCTVDIITVSACVIKQPQKAFIYYLYYHCVVLHIIVIKRY